METLTTNCIKSKEHFSVENIARYSLNLSISSKEFSYCIIDTLQNRCVALEGFPLEESLETIPLATLDSIIDEHAFLSAGYWKEINVMIEEQNFNLIPTALFSTDLLTEVLPVSTNLDHHYNSLSSIGISVAYTIPKNIKHWIQGKYPSQSINYKSPVAVLISTAQFHKVETKDTPALFIHLDEDQLHISCIKEKKLLFFNSFTTRSTEDTAYFTMLVVDQLKLDQEKTPVKITGNIHTYNSHYLRLGDFIQSLSFGSRPSSLTFGYEFDEIEEHFYFDLLSLYFTK